MPIKIFNTLFLALLLTKLIHAQHNEYPVIKTDRFSTQVTDSLISEAFKIGITNADSAIALLLQLDKECQFANYFIGRAQALFYLGMIYTAYKRDPTKGIHYFQQSLKHYNKAKKKKQAWFVSWCNNMGAAYYKLGNTDSAVYYYEQALSKSLDLKTPASSIITTYNNLSTVLIHLQQYTKARFYLIKATKIGLAENLNSDLVNTFQNMAATYIYESQFDSAMHYIDQVDNLGVSLEQYTAERQHMLSGLIYFYKHNAPKAIFHFKKALLTGDERIRVNHLNNLGAAYTLNLDYVKAKRYLELAREEGIDNGLPQTDKPLMKSIYSNLANVYDSIQSYEQAYHYRTLAYDIADTVNEMAKSDALHQIETRYRTAEKDKQIAEDQMRLIATQQQINRKNLWIVSISGGALIFSFILLSLYQRQRLKLQKAKTNQQQQQIEQLNAVLEGEEKERARIGRQLHDDIMVEFSIARINLATLPDEFPQIMSTTTFDRIEQQLNRTGIKIRQTAHNLMPDALLTEGLLYAIGYFCSGISRTAPIKINFQHFGELPKLPTEVEVNLYRMVQELVQNVIKHASASEALVQIYSRGGIISLTVDDDGVGIKDLQKAEEGMGIKSIRSRLKVMGGEMDMRSVEPSGTAVHIEISTDRIKTASSIEGNS